MVSRGVARWQISRVIVDFSVYVAPRPKEQVSLAQHNKCVTGLPKRLAVDEGKEEAQACARLADGMHEYVSYSYQV